MRKFVIVLLLTVNVFTVEMDIGTNAKASAMANTSSSSINEVNIFNTSVGALTTLKKSQLAYSIQIKDNLTNHIFEYGFMLSKNDAIALSGFIARDRVFGVAYARKLRKNFSIGGNVKVVNKTINIDLGLYLNKLFLSVKDIGGGWQYFSDIASQSTLLKAGTYFIIIPNKFIINTDLNISGGIGASIGSEITIGNIKLLAGTTLGSYSSISAGFVLNTGEDKWSYSAFYEKNIGIVHQMSFVINLSEISSINRRSENTVVEKSIQNTFKAGLENYKTGELRKAINEWEKILLLDPDNSITRDYINIAKAKLEKKVKTLLNEAEAKYKNKIYNEAISIWESVLSLDPENPIASDSLKKAKNKLRELFGKGLIYFKKGSYLYALSEWENLKKLNPLYPELEIYIEKAMEKIKASREKSGLVENYYKQGLAEYNGGNLKKALTSWRKALSIVPNNKKIKKLLANIVKVKFNKGIELFNNNKFNEAIKLWREALEIDPTNMEISSYIVKAKRLFEEKINKKFLAGVDEYNRGNYLSAIKFWREALKVDPTHKEMNAYMIKATMGQGIIYYRIGKLKEAINMWSVALKLEPNNVKAKSYLKRAKNKLKILKKLGGE